jgi:predicted nucleic acid-binding protein
VTVSEALAGVERLGLDTPPFIYYVERNPHFHAVCLEVFAEVAAGHLRVFTSALSLAETLVKPLAEEDALLQDAYNGLLTHSRGVHLVLVGTTVARTAATLRAKYGRALRLPDAVQIAAALYSGRQAFLTNDDTLERVTEIQVLIVSKLETTVP